MIDSVDNPYQAPESNITPADTLAEEIRTKHINHEASIQSIGLLYYFGALFIILAGISYTMRGLAEQTFMSFLLAGGILLLGVFQFWVARKLRALSPVAKIPTTIFSVLGLLAFPVGTLINLYILYILHCKKGRYILSPEYREIIEATPDIKYHTSILIWVLLGIILLGIVAAIVIPMMH